MERAEAIVVSMIHSETDERCRFMGKRGKGGRRERKGRDGGEGGKARGAEQPHHRTNPRLEHMQIKCNCIIQINTLSRIRVKRGGV